MDMKVGPSTDAREDEYADFTDQTKVPFDQTLVPRPARKQAVRTVGDPLSRLIIISMPFLMVLAVLFSLALKSFKPRSGEVIPLTGQGMQARIERASVKPGNADLTSPQSQPSAANTVTCALPLGWTSHIVDPTESLFRLAVQYNITPDQLQAANCMGDETTIMPGQVLFVPPLPVVPPTPTPEPTVTSTSAPVWVPYIPVTADNSTDDDSNDEPSQPAAPPKQPTSEPPPPTSQPVVPPTIAPTNPPPQPQPTNPPPSVCPADPPPNPPVLGGNGNGNGGNGNGNGNGGGKEKDKGKGNGNGGGNPKDGKGKGGKGK